MRSECCGTQTQTWQPGQIRVEVAELPRLQQMPRLNQPMRKKGLNPGAQEAQKGAYNYLTQSVIPVRVGVRVLDSEVLVLPTTPQSLYFIIVIGVCVRIEPKEESKEVKFLTLFRVGRSNCKAS